MQFFTSSTTILDEEPIVNRGLAAALMLCQNKGKQRADRPPPHPPSARPEQEGALGSDQAGPFLVQPRLELQLPFLGYCVAGGVGYRLPPLPLGLSAGLLETTVQKVARVKAPNKSLPSAVYCIEDKM